MSHPACPSTSWTRVLLAFAVTAFVGAASAQAQDTDAAAAQEEAAALAKQVQNPLATLLSIPFQANFNEGVGQYERRTTNINFQPVIPFPGKKWNLIARTIISFISIPVGETAAETGFSDLTFTLFASPAKASSVTWGVGPALILPLASNTELLGTGKVSIGPSAVVFAGAGNFTFGGVVNNVWSVAGDSDRESVNQFFAQYFLNYNFGGGWAVGTAPIITCNWEAPDGEQCTIPWGAQISKVLNLGSRPANILFGYYWNSEHPTDGAESQMRFQVNLLFPQH